MTGRPLSYSLQAETLTAGLLFYVVLGFFFGTFHMSLRLGIVMIVLWLVLGGLIALRFIALLFEYCMDILLETARGSERPPATRASVTVPRVRMLVLVIAFFCTVATGLSAVNWWLGALVWTALYLLMPAFFVTNTLVSSGAMLNPFNLAATVRHLGWVYLLHQLLFTLVAALFVFIATGPFVVYLLLFPVFLYVTFQFFHLMGLSVRARMDIFFPPVDFKADREALEAVCTSLADVNRELSETFELMRAGHEKQALDKLDLLIRRKGWPAFEQVFEYVAQWPYGAPALHLCRRYLQQPEALATPMRALELVQWCLAKDPAFTLGSAVVQSLAEHAVIPAHYRAVLGLVENHLARHPDALQRAQLLQLALFLAADKLQDEQCYARLKALA